MAALLWAGPAGKVVGHSGGFMGISARLDTFLDSGYIAFGMGSYGQPSSAVHSRFAEAVGARCCSDSLLSGARAAVATGGAAKMGSCPALDPREGAPGGVLQERVSHGLGDTGKDLAPLGTVSCRFLMSRLAQSSSGGRSLLC